MAYHGYVPFPEECATGINHAAAYQMYMSDVYLTLAYYFTEPSGKPPFAVFFEDVAEVKWEHSKEFLRYLRRREGMVRIPFIQKVIRGPLRSPEEALTYVMSLEDELTRILEALKTSASKAGETHLVNVVDVFLTKQKRCKEFLKAIILNQRKTEEYWRHRRLCALLAGVPIPDEDI